MYCMNHKISHHQRGQIFLTRVGFRDWHFISSPLRCKGTGGRGVAMKYKLTWVGNTGNRGYRMASPSAMFPDVYTWTSEKDFRVNVVMTISAPWIVESKMFRNIQYYTVLLLKVFGLVSISTMGASILHWLRLVVVAVSNHFMQGIPSVHDLAPQNCSCSMLEMLCPKSQIWCQHKTFVSFNSETRLCRFFVLKVTALVPLAPSMAMPRNIPNTARLRRQNNNQLCIHAGPILLIYKPEKWQWNHQNLSQKN